MIIDAHVHVWDPRERSYAWLDGSDLHRPLLPDRYASEARAVGGVVFVQASDADGAGEARWVDALDWPELLGIVARIDLAQEADAVRADLSELAAIERVVGVRHLLQDVDVADFPAVAEGLRILGRAGGSFDACIRATQLPALIDLLESVPDLTVVLDHVGKPPVDAGIDSAEGRAWAAGITRLATRPRTFVKLSGLAAESRDPVAFDTHTGAFLRHAVDAFGADRAMLGSDWPVSAYVGVGGTFSDWTERVRSVVSPGDWAAVSETSARRAYLPGGSRGFAPVAGRRA